MWRSLPKTGGLAVSVILAGLGISQLKMDPRTSAYLLLVGLSSLLLLVGLPYAKSRLALILGVCAAANVTQSLVTGFIIGFFRQQLGSPIGVSNHADRFHVDLVANVVLAALLLWLAFSTRDAHRQKQH